MPLADAAPEPQLVLGMPCGKRALKLAAPLLLSDFSAPNASCGSLLPLITAMNVDYLLWHRGQHPAYKQAKPRHRTRTVSY